ncbi:hypothetical protein WMF45_22905 [Sorangium sp. So ce448]|uniref:hypothetical protein n=1 Tax=Sorangium sp. So ce448 TaxID=3133314 RepID=UPI003F5FE4BE
MSTAEVDRPRRPAGCGVRGGPTQTREPSFTDCRGAYTYTFNTALSDTRCAGPGLVVFADSEVEALGCAAARAVLQGVHEEAHRWPALDADRHLEDARKALPAPFASMA